MDMNMVGKKKGVNLENIEEKYTENLFCCPNQNELNSKYVVNEILSLKVWKRTYFYKQSISSKEKCFFNLISQEVSFPVLSKSILFKIELKIEQFIRHTLTQELHKYTTQTYLQVEEYSFKLYN